MGPELFEFIQSPELMFKLKHAAARGTPPAAAISADLMAKFPSGIRDSAIKRRVGLFIAALLDAEGFSVARANVRMKDPLFATGAVYRERTPAVSESGDLISRLASAFTEEEARRLVGSLLVRFPELRKVRG
jgi:hypothetical protein